MLVKAINMDCLQVVQAAPPFSDLGLRFVCLNMETHLPPLLSLLKANKSLASEQLKHDCHGAMRLRCFCSQPKCSSAELSLCQISSPCKGKKKEENLGSEVKFLILTSQREKSRHNVLQLAAAFQQLLKCTLVRTQDSSDQ